MRAHLGGIASAFLLCLALPWKPSSAQVCQGDCGLDAVVTVDELMTIVNIALGGDVGACVVGDSSCDGLITVDEIVGSVQSALGGCQNAFMPRGDLAVSASSAEGLLREIPDGPSVGGKPRMPAQYRVDNPPEIEVRPFVTNLEVPWAIAFAPDERLFINERIGRIRVFADGVLDPEPWATININRVTQEGGLMGLALDPRFDQQPWVYICYTTLVEGQTANRVSRLQKVEGGGVNEQILVDNIPGGAVHDGCRLKFGPDGMLYASTGDGQRPANSQSLATLTGKILRIRPDGAIPDGNPFPDSYVYSYGHRNPQGLAFRGDGLLLETEHGPSAEIGGLRAHDEVNVIEAGGNYGWPEAVGAPRLPEFQDPILMYPDTAVPPAGATFYSGDQIPSWAGNFFFTSLGATHLQRVVLDACNRPLAIERLLVGTYGRLRDVIEGPDGNLYVATSNRDGRGRPASDDDRILQIVAAD